VAAGDARIAADYACGIDKLMASWREMVGWDRPHLLSEMRDVFYEKL